MLRLLLSSRQFLYSFHFIYGRREEKPENEKEFEEKHLKWEMNVFVFHCYLFLLFHGIRVQEYALSKLFTHLKCHTQESSSPHKCGSGHTEHVAPASQSEYLDVALFVRVFALCEAMLCRTCGFHHHSNDSSIIITHAMACYY